MHFIEIVVSISNQNHFALEIVVCKMYAFLSRPQCVNGDDKFFHLSIAVANFGCKQQ